MSTLRIPVELTFPAGGGTGLNVWHFRAGDDAITIADDLALGVGALEQFYIALRNMLPTTYTIKCPGNAVDVVSQQEYSTTGWQWTGNATGAGYAPASSAAVVGWRTSVAARRARGRTFIGPLAATMIEADGSLSPTAISLLTTAAQSIVDWNGGATSPGQAFGIYGQQSKGITDPKVLRDITGFKIRDSVAVLRSRRD